MNDTYAIITGATSGIGFEFARVLAEYGYNLILVARNESKLKYLKKEFTKLYNINVEYFPCDLSLKGDVENLYKAVNTNDLDVEILVNNAGFGLNGDFIDLSIEEQLDMLRVNITSLTLLTHLFANDMKERGGGNIINVSSLASFAAGPKMAVYYASKAYVTSFTESLHVELKKYNIKVTAILPGPVDTVFWKKAGVEKKDFMSFAIQDPGIVAYKAVKAMMHNRTLKLTSILGMFAVCGVHILPRLATRYITAFTNKNS